MSIETERGEETSGRSVTELATELGEAIADLPEYERYEDAQRAVEDSEDAQERIREFEGLREEFMLARQTGEATQEDLRNLQEKQQELHSIPVMAEYLEAQNELDARLEAINDALSAPLDMSFADEAGGCCND